MSQAVEPPKNTTLAMSRESDQTVLESTRSPESLELNFKTQSEEKAKRAASQETVSGSPRALSLEEGFILPGRYQVKNALGKGGFGSVYAGIDLNLDRPIAIKLLSNQLEGQAAQRFKDEGRLIAKLQHPHIIQVYAFNELDFNCPFLVMEHFGTGSLKDHWHNDERPSLTESCQIIAQLLDALSAAHEIGVVHRDIKEANILYDHRKQIAKLCDFGIARAVERLEDQAQTTKEGCVIGTGHYIAPERYKGNNHDPRSDLYSVGVLFYRLLTGRRPHESYYGEPLAPGVVMYRSSYETPAKIINVPRAIERVCLRLLERNIEFRYQEAKQARTDLLEALNSPETESYEYELGNDSHLYDSYSKLITPSGKDINLSTQELVGTINLFHLLKRLSAPIAFILGMILFVLIWMLSGGTPSPAPTVIKLGSPKTNIYSNTRGTKTKELIKSGTGSQSEKSKQLSSTSHSKKGMLPSSIHRSKKEKTHLNNRHKKKGKAHSSSRPKASSKSRRKTRQKENSKLKSQSPYIFPMEEANEASSTH